MDNIKMTVNVAYILRVFWTLLELESEVSMIAVYQIYISVLGVTESCDLAYDVFECISNKISEVSCFSP
jgi:hypothetical protein